MQDTWTILPKINFLVDNWTDLELKKNYRTDIFLSKSLHHQNARRWEYGLGTLKTTWIGKTTLVLENDISLGIQHLGEKQQRKRHEFENDISLEKRQENIKRWEVGKRQ